MTDAKEFLMEMLADGPVPSNAVLEAAKQRGISEITLRRAGKLLGIKPEKSGFGGGW